MFFISAFSVVHSMMLYVFFYYSHSGWRIMLFMLDTCTDVVAFLNMTSSALHRVRGIIGYGESQDLTVL